MRADRLLSVLLLLQARGRVTAAEVADELEISERTARRDLDALAVAGVPLYSRQGRNGGWELMGGSKTDLTGLTAPEARALFLVAGPAATASPAVKIAVRKLLQAMPEPMRREAEAASNAVLVESGTWRNNTAAATPSTRPDFLDRIEQAVIEGEQVELGYADRTGHASIRTIHPLGLASKGSVWYLVADTAAGLRTFRLSRVRSAEGTGDRVVRPPDFDLGSAWRDVTAAIQDTMQTVSASGRALPDKLPLLRAIFGDRLRLGPQGPAGFQLVEIVGPSARVLAVDLAGLSGFLVIDSPAEVRDALAAIGRRLVNEYERDHVIAAEV
jgi:predicted DNA-binding transcriptional regulator YafY